MIRELPKISIRESYVPFKGGLDTVTPALSVKPGTCRESDNFYQDVLDGYIPFQGYERFDGQPAPSDAAYAMLTVSLTGSVSVGDTLTSVSEVLDEDNGDEILNEDGTFMAQETNEASGAVIATESTALALTKVTGTFPTGDIYVGSTLVGTCTGPQLIDAASTPLLRAQYANLAADVYRADISAVPGSGNVLGVFNFKDVVYAFRNNAGGTAVDLYKSSSSGWTQVSLGFEHSFTSGGTYEISEGDTITGASSSATAVITRVVLESGTWAGGDAAGRLIYASKTGTFVSENLNVGANLNVATVAGDGTAITIPVISGRYETVKGNFTASKDTERIYGCDGKNRGFEFDGTVYVPISTGMTTDTPEHVAIFKGHLFFSFLGSVQHAAPGTPYIWSVILGAAELGVGEQVTGMQLQAGGDSGSGTVGSLAIFTRNSIHVLYGTSVSDWVLVSYEQEVGAIEWSIQLIGSTFFLDDRGISDIKTASAYGNFQDSAWSNHILPLLSTKKQNTISSCVVREKNQYMLFFSDKTGIITTVDNGKPVAMMPITFNSEVRCVHTSENLSGNEVIYFGDENGYVHQMYKGTSFDGDEIEAYIHLAFDNEKSPNVKKRWRAAILEASGTGYYAFDFSYNIGYGSSEIAQSDVQSHVLALEAGVWDSGNWDSGFWDGMPLAPKRIRMTGNGVNVSLKIRSKSDYYNPVKFSGAIQQYSIGRGKR